MLMYFLFSRPLLSLVEATYYPSTAHTRKEGKSGVPVCVGGPRRLVRVAGVYDSLRVGYTDKLL